MPRILKNVYISQRNFLVPVRKQGLSHPPTPGQTEERCRYPADTKLSQGKKSLYHYFIKNSIILSDLLRPIFLRRDIFQTCSSERCLCFLKQRAESWTGKSGPGCLAGAGSSSRKGGGKATSTACRGRVQGGLQQGIGGEKNKQRCS